MTSDRFRGGETVPPHYFSATVYFDNAAFHVLSRESCSNIYFPISSRVDTFVASAYFASGLRGRNLPSWTTLKVLRNLSKAAKFWLSLSVEKLTWSGDLPLQELAGGFAPDPRFRLPLRACHPLR